MTVFAVENCRKCMFLLIARFSPKVWDKQDKIAEHGMLGERMSFYGKLSFLSNSLRVIIILLSFSRVSRYFHGRKCANCNRDGHLAKSCPEPKKNPVCFMCMEEGHSHW